MPTQRSFEELGTPLAGVTFCVVDLETTGGSAADDAITEIGAVKVCGGSIVGTFHTLVDPGTPVPAFIRLLTGITDEMLIEAPAIEAVLPSFIEFSASTILVAHNARFDVGFLNAALRRGSYPELDNQVIDTAKLARKILAGEVPNNKLSTLASHLRCPHQPEHRAFADVLATIDVLHHLIERVAGFGVTTLEDLVSMSRTRMDGTFRKISLSETLPHAMGVYRFIGPTNNVLYVGKATDIRNRVRSYFYGDPRRKIRDLLREAQSIECDTYPTMIEAEIAEARLIARELPPYNRAGKRTRSWYLKVDMAAKVPRIAPARAPKPGRALYIGPLPSMRTARVLMDALRDTARIHRCTDPRKCGDCPYADLGTCAGNDSGAQRAELRVIARAVAGDARPAFNALAERMQRLARDERFEEAAELRERGSLLERSLRAGICAEALARAGDVVIDIDRRALLFRDGLLVAKTWIGPGGEYAAVSKLRDAAPPAKALPYVTEAHQRDARVIAAWLRRTGDGARVLFVEHAWAEPVSAAPSGLFEVKPSTKSSAGDVAYAGDTVEKARDRSRSRSRSRSRLGQ